MDSSKEIFKQIKEQDASGFGCITDQKLLFLDQNSFLQQGGHRGDEDKMQEHDQEQLKDKHIFLSEVVGNDTIQFQKFTEDDVFVSAEDPRFYDLQPQNKGILTDFPHEVVFKNCTSKYTLSDVLSKNCNTPLKHQKLQSYDFTIKPQRSKSDIQNPKDLSAIPQSDQQIAAESILQNSAEKEVSVGNKLVVQNQPAVDFAQQKRNSTNQNLDNNFSIKRNLIAISNRLKSDKISSSYVEHNNLHSTCTPNNRISRQLKSNKISSNQNSNHIKNLVTKLIDSLKKPQFQYYTKFFQFAEHKFIEDKTIFWDSKEKTEQQKTALRNFSDIVQVFIRNIFIFERLIERTDVFLKMWNCFQFLFFTALIFIYSIDSAFNYEILGNNSRNVLFAMCFCFLFGESLINQNMEQYYNDQIITDKKQIQDQYFRKGLLFDLLLLIILSIKLVFLNKSIENIYSLQIILDLTIIFFYTLKFYKLSQIIYEICLNEWQQKTFEITKILISNLVIAHLSNYFNFFVYFQLTFYLFKKSVTISLIYLCNIEAKLGYNQNMLSNLDYLGNDLVHKYLIVYFWAITSLTISGGDGLKPQTKLEIVFSCVAMIVLCSVLFYSVFKIFFDIFNNMKYEQKHHKNVRILLRYLNRNQIYGRLELRIKNYMNSVKQQQRNEDLYNETEAIKDLPKNLQDEIVKGINTKIFQKIVFFTQTFSKQTNEQLTNKMRKVVFNPNEIIFEQQKVDDQSIYLITNGIVELFYHNYKSQKVIANLQKNQYFGEISFFSGQSRSASARSLTFTTAYKISRQDFLDVIYSKQKDHERYKMIEEQILFQNNLKCIKVNCFGCQQIGHTVNQCPFLNPQFDKQASFLRYKFQHINQRKHFLRNTNKNSKNNTLMALKTNTEFAKKLQINLNIEQSFYSTEEENYDNDEFSLNPSKKMTENQLNNFNSNKSYDTLQFNEEYSPKLQKPKSTKSLCSKKYELNSADSQLQQCQLKDYEQNSLIANSFAGSPIFLPTNYQQDTQSEIIKGQSYQMNQVQRINSDLARLSLEEELMKKKNRIESIDKVSLKQSFLSSLKEIYKSLSFENILPAPFGPNLNQSLNILDKICSQLSSSYDQEEFDKKFQYYYEQIKEPSIKVLLKESSSFSNLKKIDPQSISQIYDKKLNQMFSINRQYQTQKEINDSTQEENELIVNSYFGNQNIVFQNFDRICHFNTFFPQNNFNQIHKQLKMQQIMNLQKIKQINSNYQSSPKNGNKKSLTKEEKNECELHLNNQNLFRTQGITSISYGVGYRINRNSPQTK